jgi:hypothetical protein
MPPQRLLLIALLLRAPAACGNQGASPPSSGVPPLSHVFIVVEENTDYADVIGGSAMPYLESLAQEYGLATQYYADTHPSIGNYFMTTG